MRDFVISMEEIRENDGKLIGSKAFSLHTITGEELKVPPFICITTEAYERYLESTSLKGRIIMELSRKDIKDMRWEEMWDTSLRIRNMFLNTPIPEEPDRDIREQLIKYFSDTPVVVRSSAPGEDSEKTSFAGLHESYVNVRGIDSIMEHIRLVWASLWSDAALLYRDELGLDIKHSSMAVLVQELVAGEVSGIVFSKGPENNNQMVIEAVHGLNKGLVDGDVEPDRWVIDREEASIIKHSGPSFRDKIVRLKETGTALEKLPENLSDTIPLKEKDVLEIHYIALKLEKKFGLAQDIEWTKRDDEIYVLQSRPVTISQNREKLWYLSLRRNIDNLHALRKKIEDKLIPNMIGDAKALQSVNPALLDDNELAGEIIRRKKLYEEWDKRYTDEFIPFAHGMRLFGQVYNDRVKPSNPYEFMDLLSGSEMLSIKRNEGINRLAGILRNDASLMDKAKNGAVEGDFAGDFEKLFRDFGHSGIFRTRENLLNHIIKLASNPEKEKQDQKDISELERSFISALEKEEKSFAEELLEIARISYRLRDDDNIHLGRIEHQYLLSLNEAKMRIAARSDKLDPADDLELEELIKALMDSAYIPEKKVRISRENVVLDQRKTVRQIQGQPAGEGLVTGRARVITENEELFNIRSGEIMVCDSIDPNMTFVVPLVSGIVERRGGMLIHGAIIAREYGIPCVTGIPEATRIVANGDEVTVDGYLGIVTIRKNERKEYQ